MIFEEPYIPPKKAYNFKHIEYELGGPNGDCWVCTSHIPNTDGYPNVKRHGKSLTLSKYVYEISKGSSVEEGLHVLHSCDNRLCINPSHLSEGTISENMRQMWERNRTKRPDPRYTKTKLTDRDIYEIKHLVKYRTFSQRRIGELYGCSTSSIEGIARGKRWTHITI